MNPTQALYALAPALVAADTKKASGSLQQEENETNEEDEGKLEKTCILGRCYAVVKLPTLVLWPAVIGAHSL